MFVTLALRNIVKHGKRSLVVIVAVAVAVGVLSGISGTIRGMTDTVLESIVPTAGHVVIRAAASENAINPTDLKYLIPDIDDVLARLKDPHVVAAEPVITFGALLVEPVETDAKKEARNLGMLGQGVQADTKFLQNLRSGMVQGTFLPGGEAAGSGIALSRRAADLLGVQLGGSVMVLTTDRGNNPWYQELTITGLFETGSEQVDLSLFAVSLETARDLVDAAGMAREVRLLLDDPEAAPAVAQALRALLVGQSTSGLLVSEWQVTFSSVLTILTLLNILFFIIRLFFVIVAASVITNSILMTVFERIREYGTLRAIGLKARQLRALILTEGLFLGLAGALLGLSLGIPVVVVLSQVGLDLGSATESIGFATRIYPHFAWLDAGFNLIFGTLIAVVASFYAARVSSRLSVSESLSHT